MEKGEQEQGAIMPEQHVRERMSLDTALSQLAEASRDHFRTSIVDTESAREAAIKETMQGIQELASGFAQAMIETDMPVDRLTHNVLDSAITQDRLLYPSVVGIQSYPLWLIVKEKDLSNREMRRAHIDKEVAHHSLGSGSYSGSHHEHTVIDPATAKKHNLRSGETLRYHADIIAVSSLGRLLKVRDSYFDTKNSRFYTNNMWPDRTYDIASLTVKPADLFDTESKVKPRVLLARMKNKLDSALEEYRLKLHEERDNSWVYRDQSYYEVQDLTVPIPAEKDDEFPRRGRGVRRWLSSKG